MPSTDEELAELKRQVARQGELIDRLYRHLSLDDLAVDGSAPAVSQEITDAIRSGQMIVAIKLWRERTGVGLAEAKAAVEAYARTL